MVRSVMAAKWSIFGGFSGYIDPKHQRVVKLSRPHFCISDTPIYPVNYPEELGAIRELGRVHGFSPSASGLLLKAHICDLGTANISTIYGSRYFLSRLVFLKGDWAARMTIFLAKKVP